jgi:putative oxidoreductase
VGGFTRQVQFAAFGEPHEVAACVNVPDLDPPPDGGLAVDRTLELPGETTYRSERIEATLECAGRESRSGAVSVTPNRPVHQMGGTSPMDSLQTIWAPRLLSILRVVVALIFLEHGTQKLLGFPISDRPAPELLTMGGIAGVLELVGGTLLVLGLFTRPVAFILSGQMAVAYWIAHAPQNFFPVNNGGDAAILYCFVFLYLFAAGAGPWSLDVWLRGKGEPAARTA